MCETREQYLYKRLLELSFIAETRELDPVEREEEVRLEQELKSILNNK